MLTAAVVGCGGIGGNHMRALSTLEGVELRYVVDLDADRAAEQASRHEADPLTSVGALPPSLDFVVVATPPMAHYPVVRDLLDRDFHVFCEKPLTLNVASGEALADLAARRGLHLGVGFKMRYEPWFAKARDLIGEIGPILQVTTTKHQALHDKPWLPETGAMQELSSHDFDLVSWITSARPTRMIHAYLSYRRGWPAEDGFSLLVEYDNGMAGTLTGLYGDRIRFTGRDSTMRFMGQQGYLAIDRGERVILHGDEVTVYAFEKRVDGFRMELDAFAAAVRGGKADYPDATAAIRSIWVVEQAYRAAGREVPAQPDFGEVADD